MTSRPSISARCRRTWPTWRSALSNAGRWRSVACTGSSSTAARSPSRWLSATCRICCRNLTLRANALYLDGFSPTRNPEMWSSQLCRQLKRLSAADVTLATWTVSAALRRALADACFVTDKRTGLKPKRDMLGGALHPEARSAALRHRPETSAPGRVAVIGAGLAGCAMAERLATRGIEVVLIERHRGPCTGSFRQRGRRAAAHGGARRQPGGALLACRVPARVESSATSGR
jgi:hypothetical protein